jgi:hypothetical protein
MTKPTLTGTHHPSQRRSKLKRVIEICGRRGGDWRDLIARRLAVSIPRKWSFPVDRQTRRLIQVYRHELAGERLAKTHREYYATFCGAREILSNRSQRLMLEAAIVSRLPSEEIAERLGISLDVVKIYEAAFFDVREHLEVSNMFSTHVLPPAEVDAERPPWR